MSLSRFAFAPILLALLCQQNPALAEVVLTAPAEGAQFAPDQRRIFKWQAAADDPGPFVSTLVVAPVLENQTPAQALAENVPLFTAELPAGALTVPHPGATFSHEYETALTPDQHNGLFAWQVDIHSEATGDDVSAIHTFKTPLIAESIGSGNSWFATITNTTNNDIANLSGTATVKWRGDYLPVTFSGIQTLDQYGDSSLVLAGGQLDATLEGSDALQAYEPGEGAGTFDFHALRFIPNTVEGQGAFTWNHPRFGTIVTDTAWVQLDELPDSIITLGHSETLQVPEVGLEIALQANSYLSLNEVTFRGYLDGTITSTEGPALSMTFVQAEALSYDEELEESHAEISPLKNLGLVVHSALTGVDFSVEQTPSYVAEEPDWQGLTFRELSVSLSETEGSVLTFEGMSLLPATGSARFSAGTLDLDLWVSLDSQEASLLGFPAKLTSLLLKSSADGIDAESGIRGTLTIPYLNASYDFMLPVTEAGLGDPKLLGDLPEGLVIRRDEPRIVWFELEGEVGAIDHAQQTITLDVPAGFPDYAAAKFVAIGTSITVEGVEQVSSETSNRFDTTVTYEVTAFDGSVTEYEVIVNEPAPNDDDDDDSPTTMAMEGPPSAELLLPADGSSSVASPTTFAWRAGEESPEGLQFSLYLCTSPTFVGAHCDIAACEATHTPSLVGSTRPAAPPGSGQLLLGFGALGLLALAMTSARFRRPRFWLAPALGLACAVGCSGVDPAASSSEVPDDAYSCKVGGLESDTRYFWKVASEDLQGVRTDSPVFDFRTRP